MSHSPRLPVFVGTSATAAIPGLSQFQAQTSESSGHRMAGMPRVLSHNQTLNAVTTLPNRSRMMQSQHHKPMTVPKSVTETASSTDKEEGEVSDLDDTGPRSASPGIAKTYSAHRMRRNKVMVDKSNFINTKPSEVNGYTNLARQRAKAKEFILAWQKHGYTYSQLVAETLDADFLRGIYAELGIETVVEPRTTIPLPAKPASVLSTSVNQNIPEASAPYDSQVAPPRVVAVDAIPKAIDNATAQPLSKTIKVITATPERPDTKSSHNDMTSTAKHTILSPILPAASAETSLQNNTTVVPTNRNDYIARLKAAKSKRVESQPDLTPANSSVVAAAATDSEPVGVTESSQPSQPPALNGAAAIPADTRLQSSIVQPTLGIGNTIASDSDKPESQTELARLRLRALQSARLSLAAKAARTSANVTPSISHSHVGMPAVHAVNGGESSTPSQPSADQTLRIDAIDVPESKSSEKLPINHAENGTFSTATTSGQNSSTPTPVELSRRQSQQNELVTPALLPPRIPGLFMTLPSVATVAPVENAGQDLDGPQITPLTSDLALVPLARNDSSSPASREAAPIVPFPVRASGRKRPVAADFDDDSSSRAPKKLFGHPRGYVFAEGIIIEASDDEDDSNDELVTDELVSGVSRHAGLTERPDLERTFSSASRGDTQGMDHTNTRTDAPVTQSAISARDISSMKSREAQILVMKKKIAELEEKRKAKALASGTTTPATPKQLDELAILADSPAVVMPLASALSKSEEVLPILMDPKQVLHQDFTGGVPALQNGTVHLGKEDFQHGFVTTSDKINRPASHVRSIIGTMHVSQPIVTEEDSVTATHPIHRTVSDTSASVAAETQVVETNGSETSSAEPQHMEDHESAVLHSQHVSTTTTSDSETSDSSDSGEESEEDVEMVDVNDTGIDDNVSETKSTPAVVVVQPTNSQDIEFATPTQSVDDPSPSTTRLYIGNLPSSATDEMLRSLFRDFPVTSIILHGKAHKGSEYGFVELVNASDSNHAINTVNGKHLEGKQISVQAARLRSERTENVHKEISRNAPPVQKFAKPSGVAGQDANGGEASVEFSNSTKLPEKGSDTGNKAEEVVLGEEKLDSQESSDSESSFSPEPIAAESSSEDYEPPDTTQATGGDSSVQDDASEDADSDYEPPDTVPDSAPLPSPSLEHLDSRSPSLPPTDDNSLEPLRTPHEQLVVDNNAVNIQKNSAADRPLSDQASARLIAPLMSYFTPYESPLRTFKAYRFRSNPAGDVVAGIISSTYSHNINPDEPVCAYETAGGICNDSSCDSQHFRSLILSDDELLRQLGTTYPLDLTDVEKQTYNQGLTSIMTNMRNNGQHSIAAIAARILAYRRKFTKDPSVLLDL